MIVATETWLDSSVVDGELFSNSYNIYRRDRQSTSLSHKSGGGVLFAVSDRFESRRIEHYESMHEDLWINIKFENGGVSKNLLVCVLYLPPPVDVNTLNAVLDNISSVMRSYQGDLLILGDFNLGFINWTSDVNNPAYTSPTNYSSNLGFLLVDFLSLNNLVNYNSIKNHNGRVLDLVLANFENIKVSNSLDLLSKLDPHHPVLDIVITKNQNKVLTSKPFATHCFKKANYSAVNSALRNVDWDYELKNCPNVNIMVQKFYCIFNRTIDSTIPKFKYKNWRHPVWFTSNLQKLISEKEKIRRRVRIYSNPRDKLELSLAKNRVESLMKNCYSDYIKVTEQAISREPRKFWSYIKQRKDISTQIPSEMSLDNKTTSSGSEISNLFAEHFSSLFSDAQTSNQINNVNFTEFFTQKSLSRIENITERDIDKVLKSLDPSKGAGPDGIPPIFIKKCHKYLTLPLKIILDKSLESSTFPDAWKAANILPIFKKGAKHNAASRLYLTDFSSAFDKVDHSILILKLRAYGIHDPLLSWFRSYLVNRTLSVTVKGYTSDPFIATSGVPQGSHLGPILFLLFINDITQSIKYSECSIFADNLKIYWVIKNAEDSCLLQKDLNSIQDWCTKNKMILNASKCAHIKFTRKKNIVHSKYFIQKQQLEEVSVIRDFGIILDSRLTFKDHIDYIASKAWKLLGFIRRNTADFKRTDCITRNPHYRAHVNRLERVQRSFTRYLAFKDNTSPYRANYAARLKHFKLHPLEKRRQVTDLITLFKIVRNNLDSPDLLYQICISVPRRNFDIKNAFCSSRPVTDKRNDIFETVKLDRHLSSYDIDEDLRIDHKAVLTHLKKASLMDHVLICDSLLRRNDIKPFLKGLITGDLKWIAFDKNVRKYSKVGQAAQTVASRNPDRQLMKIQQRIENKRRIDQQERGDLASRQHPTTWTLTSALCSKLEAFEMWIYRRMLRISWTMKITNVEVLRRMNKRLEIMRIVKERKLQYFGHIMRGHRYRILQLVIEGKIEGKRRPGRRKISWLKNLREWFNLSTRSLFRAAASKIKIAMMVANLRREEAP
ncbi:uncharacterized protein LOC123657427 [Melitaea cinxia]|uniref:uncharacterized protein LOC123657427 n=1 Tax=Melitaea cinxia TaxID=113334 RepID=UPI001E272971|nr:uncharacterized protein LOC123657427 [Melitaea cinxia]